MIIRLYGVSVRGGPAAVALAAAALAIGAVFVAFGILLLLGLVAVGTVVGAGALLLRALTGRSIGGVRTPLADGELDPALEVIAPQSAAEPPPHKLPGIQAHKLE